MGGVLLTKGSWSSGEGEILDSEEESRPDYGDFSPRALLGTINRTTSPHQLVVHGLTSHGYGERVGESLQRRARISQRLKEAGEALRRDFTNSDPLFLAPAHTMSELVKLCSS